MCRTLCADLRTDSPKFWYGTTTVTSSHSLPLRYNETMLRRTSGLSSLHVKGIPRSTKLLRRCQSSPAKTDDGEDHREARSWFAKFSTNTIPKNIGEVTFSRSSGPGGQNVNK